MEFRKLVKFYLKPIGAETRHLSSEIGLACLAFRLVPRKQPIMDNVSRVNRPFDAAGGRHGLKKSSRGRLRNRFPKCGQLPCRQAQAG